MSTTIVTRESKGGRLSNIDMTNNLINLQTTADAAAPQVTTYTKAQVDAAIIVEATRAQAAEALKAPLASPTFTGTVSGITKAMVGLGSVDNTTDATKPVSTAQAAAIALKADQAITYTKTETDSRIQAVVGAAPLALDTLVEIAAQLASDQSAAGALTSAVALKADKATTYTKVEVDTAIAGATPSYATLTGKPTTLSGFGIADSMTATAIAAAIAVETNARVAADNSLTDPTYTVTGITGATAAITVDLSLAKATTIVLTLPSGTTAANVNFTNLPTVATANKLFAFSVILSHVTALTSVTSVSWTFGASLKPKFTGNITPPNTVTANATDIWSFFTYDSGASLVGSLSMADVRNA